MEKLDLYTWNKDISYDSEYKDNISNLWWANLYLF